MDKAPRKSSAREVTETIVESSIGLVPIAGGPMATVFGAVMGFAYGRRMQAWLDDLAETVTNLEGRPDIEDLADNDVFVDAVIHATRAAQATHDQAKLDALRHAVGNSVGKDAPVADEQARFFRLVDQFTGTHLRLLAFADDPAEVFDTAGVPKPGLVSGSKSQLLEALPEFTGRRDWYGLVFSDLADASLAHNVLGTGVSDVWSSMLTPLGQRFMTFIRA